MQPFEPFRLALGNANLDEDSWHVFFDESAHRTDVARHHDPTPFNRARRQIGLTNKLSRFCLDRKI
jgi:hypothetical protein